MKRCPLCARSFPESERFCSEHALPLQSEPSQRGYPKGELTGHVLDQRYHLGGILGRGGMGTVYDAQNFRIAKRCAVKVLLPELCLDVKMRQRLFREIRAASEIHHPSVVEIYDYGEDERAGTYLVMEFLGGRGLDAVLKEQQSLSVSYALKIALGLCAALRAIHKQGLVHCDVKPANIQILDGGRVKLLDFGLVKPYDRKSAEYFQKITTDGMTFGTPQYMSPEQATLSGLDPRSDIYSLGIVLFEMLLGSAPFQGETPLAILESHRSAQIPLPIAVNPKVVLPPVLELLVLRMLSKDVDARPQSVDDLAEALQTVAHDQGVDLGSVDVSALAAGQTPVTEPTRPMDLTLPMPIQSQDLDHLVALAQEDRDRIIGRVMRRLTLSIPRYSKIPKAELAAHLQAWFGALLEQLRPSPTAGLPVPILDIILDRSTRQFALGELLGAFWISVWGCRPLIERVASSNLSRYRELEDRIDHRLLPFFLSVAEQHMEKYLTKITRTSELLAAQNQELIALRNELSAKVQATHDELVEAERVKARVTDSIASGLLLLGLHGRTIELFNHALERLSGLEARDVLGRPVDDVFHLIEGVPFEEFAEQVREHGEVGLRKLRVRFPNGRERTIYVRGQAYLNGQRMQTGVLFLVDDVTEREKVIESFTRFVSREVANRILRGGGAVDTHGELKHATLLSVAVPGFSALLPRLSPEQVVDLLDNYIRVVGDAVFHHGGVIDSILGDSVLVYFDGRDRTCDGAVEAAFELLQAMRTLSKERALAGLPLFGVALGLNVGDVLCAAFGGERRMVHAVLGRPVAIAHALARAAGEGEVLITPDVAHQLSKHVQSMLAAPLQLPDDSDPIQTLKLAEPSVAPS